MPSSTTTGEDSREDNVFMAKLAEQAERFEEMISYMKKISQMDVELTVEERNLLSVAYKNIIGARRSSWRILASLEQKQEKKGNQERVEKIKQYKKKVEKELHDICDDILNLLDKHLIPSSKTAESKVFHYKLKGDYYRYLAEVATPEQRKADATSSQEAYQKAFEIANGDLLPTNPIRLGVALNFSVFYYEILDTPDRACELAKQAFEEAIAGLEKLSGDAYKDTTIILQLIKDNLILWTSNGQAATSDSTKVEDVQNQENRPPPHQPFCAVPTTTTKTTMSSPSQSPEQKEPSSPPPCKKQRKSSDEQHSTKNKKKFKSPLTKKSPICSNFTKRTAEQRLADLQMKLLELVKEKQFENEIEYLKTIIDLKSEELKIYEEKDKEMTFRDFTEEDQKLAQLIEKWTMASQEVLEELHREASKVSSSSEPTTITKLLQYFQIEPSLVRYDITNEVFE